MKKLVTILTSIVISAWALTTYGEPASPVLGLTADVVPLSLSIRKSLADDVGTPSYYLRTAVVIKNIGRLAVVPGTSQYTVAIGSRTLRGFVYGPASRGGRLGDKLFPGESGLFMVSMAIGELSHCRNVRVHIDVTRQMQSGGNSVYANDVKTLTAIDPASLRPCFVSPLPIRP